MKFEKLTFVLIAFVLSFGALAQVNTDPNSVLPLDKKIVTGTLENGLKYYIVKNETPKNRAELSIAVKAGSIDEDDDQQGLAHFCEHMAFNGTKNFPKHELVNYLESIGMKFGAEVNAYTSFDETVYGITVPLDSMKIVDKGLQVLADWATGVSFENEEIDKERGIIHEEWRLGQGAQDRMMKKVLPVIFYNSKYANRIPIGTMEVVDKCPYDALKRFYRDWYRPDLMGVIVVGDFDTKVMEQKIKDLFSKIPKAKNPREKKYFDIPDHDQPMVAVVTDKEAPATSAQLYYKHNEFKIKTVNDYKKSLVHNLYGMMITKRLQEIALQPDAPFVQAASMYTKFLGPKDILISFAMTKNTGVEAGLEALLVENERVKKFGFTATELEREKKSLLREVETQFNEKDKRKSVSVLNEIKGNFLNDDAVPGIEYEFELCKKLVPEIKLDELNALAKEWIQDKNLVALVQAPEKEGVVVPSEDKIKQIIAAVKTKDIKAYEDKVVTKPLVSKMPEPGKIEKKTEDKKLGTTEWVLSNGIKVVFKNTDFKKDEILFSAYSLGGFSNIKQDDAISCELATAIIQESGIGEFDKTELDKYLSDKIANVTPWIRETEEGMSGNCSPKDFETLMQLVYLHFTAPRKDENAFKSYLAKEKASLENKSMTPDMVFRDSITAVMANNHPRRRPMSVKLLDEANFKRAHYVYANRFRDPNSFTFFFVGNIDLKAIEPFVLKYLGGLPQVGTNETYKDLGILAPTGKIDKVVKKGKDQRSMVFMAYTGDLKYSQNSKTDLEILTKILNIKLIESIREDKSGVYSIGSYPQVTHYPKERYSIVIFFPCSPDNIDKLSDGVYAEIDKLVKNGPTEVDLNKAKEQSLRERETNLRENSFWLGTLKAISFDNEKNTVIDDYEKYIKNLKIDDIKKAASTYFNQNNFVRVSLRPEN